MVFYFSIVDINECTENYHNCLNDAICKNKPGSFECQCKTGFEGDGKTVCKDINECITQDCGDNSICINDVGSFTCECKSGYEMNIKKKCVDINECDGNNNCDDNADCLNNQGGYSCQCLPGFVGDGKQCDPIPTTTTPTPTTTPEPGTFRLFLHL